MKVSYDFKLSPLISYNFISIRVDRAFTSKLMEQLILMIAAFQDVIVRWHIFLATGDYLYDL